MINSIHSRLSIISLQWLIKNGDPMGGESAFDSTRKGKGVSQVGMKGLMNQFDCIICVFYGKIDYVVY